jgi:hypothetical protein
MPRLPTTCAPSGARNDLIPRPRARPCDADAPEGHGHSAGPPPALDLLARIHKRTAHIGKKSFHGTRKTTSEQLELFDAPSLQNRPSRPV